MLRNLKQTSRAIACATIAKASIARATGIIAAGVFALAVPGIAAAQDEHHHDQGGGHPSAARPPAPPAPPAHINPAPAIQHPMGQPAASPAYRPGNNRQDPNGWGSQANHVVAPGAGSGAWNASGGTWHQATPQAQGGYQAPGGYQAQGGYPAQRGYQAQGGARFQPPPGAVRSGPGWQGGDRVAPHGNYQAWGHEWHNDPRYDWRGWREENRAFFHVGRYYPPDPGYYYSRLSIGFILDPLFFGQSYWIGDPWYYHLPPAYPPYRWVRYYNDALLVDTYTGQVVEANYDFFW
jgi:hypothetical protein